MTANCNTPPTTIELLKTEFDGKDRDHLVTLDTNPVIIKAILQPVVELIEDVIK